MLKAKIHALPLWAAIVYTLITLTITILAFTSPGLLLMPAIGRADSKEINQARKDWEQIKHDMGISSGLLDTYIYAQIAVGDKLWYASTFDALRNAHGTLMSAAEFGQAISAFKESGAEKFTADMLPAQPDSANLVRYISYMEFRKLTEDKEPDLYAITAVIEKTVYIAILYHFLGALLFISCLRLPSPLLHRLLLKLSKRR